MYATDSLTLIMEVVNNDRLPRGSSYEFWPLDESVDMPQPPPLMVLESSPPPPLISTNSTGAGISPMFSDEERSREEEDDGTSTPSSSHSNSSSFRRRSPLMVVQHKKNITSRLLGSPPERKLRRCKRSSRLQAAAAAAVAASKEDVEEEDEDPFLEEDVPDEYKIRWKVSWFVMVEWVSLILIIAALICNLTVPNMKAKMLYNLQLWKWEVMVLVLICGRLVSSWVISILVFFIERNFLLRKRVLYFVYGLKSGVLNSLWLGLVLLAWRLLLDKKLRTKSKFSNALEHVTGVLTCLLVGTIIWLVKTLVVKVLTSSFHVSTYFDRIQDALFDQFIIKNLTGLPLIVPGDDVNMSEKIVEIEELQKLNAVALGITSPHTSSLKNTIIANSRLMSTSSGRKVKGLKGTAESSRGKDTITIDHLHRLTPRNVSAWNMKRLMHLVHHEKLVILDEQLSNQSAESGYHINSECEAREAARKIFKNVAKPSSKFIYMEDLMRFMVEDDAEKTMTRFEVAFDRRFRKGALKHWVVNVFRERRALTLTLNDTKTSVARLHHIVSAIVGIVIFIIWLLIMGIASKKLLVLICSQMVLVVFIFGNTCKNIFESIIFLFVMHPFDVGDRCEIDNVEMIVEEMNILTTVFLRDDNLKITVPNAILAMKAISNYRRSPDMREKIEFCVHIATPADKITAMKQRINSYIEKKSKQWAPGPLIFFKNMEELDRIRVAVWVSHRINHHYMDEKWARRGRLVQEMVNIFNDLDIIFTV